MNAKAWLMNLQCFQHRCALNDWIGLFGLVSTLAKLVAKKFDQLRLVLLSLNDFFFTTIVANTFITIQYVACHTLSIILWQNILPWYYRATVLSSCTWARYLGDYDAVADYYLRPGFIILGVLDIIVVKLL